MPHSVTDTDKEVQQFFNACYTAGPSHCAFYGNASSPGDIASSLDSLYSSLRVQPIAAYSGPDASYGIVDYDLLHTTVLQQVLLAGTATFVSLALEADTLRYTKKPRLVNSLAAIGLFGVVSSLTPLSRIQSNQEYSL